MSTVRSSRAGSATRTGARRWSGGRRRARSAWPSRRRRPRRGPGEGDGHAGHRPGRRAEEAVVPPKGRAGTGHVGHRGEVDVGADAAQQPPGRGARRPRRGRAGGADSLRPARRRPWQAPHQAALLVDHDQQRGAEAGGARDRLQAPIRARAPSSPAMLPPSSSTAPASPRRMRASSSAGGRAGEAVDDLLPGELGRRQPGRRRGRDGDQQRGDEAADHGPAAVTSPRAPRSPARPS